MPISDFISRGPDISEDDITNLESTLSVRLPDDYRAFLLRFNGGRPLPEDAFSFLPNKKNGSILSRFYSVTHEKKSNTIASRRYAFRNRIPGDLLPIGNDLGGSKICIGIGENNHGKVYFWAMEDETPEDVAPDYRNVRCIAESFTEHLAAFYDPDTTD